VRKILQHSDSSGDSTMTKLKLDSRLVTLREVDEILAWLKTVEHHFPGTTLGEIWFTHSYDALEFRLRFGL